MLARLGLRSRATPKLLLFLEMILAADLPIFVSLKKPLSLVPKAGVSTTVLPGFRVVCFAWSFG